MSIQGRRLVVCVVWFAVGLMLIWRGLPYLGLRDVEGVTGLQPPNTWYALAGAVILGIGKGMSALKKGARRAVTHIVKQGETAPAWSVFSPVMFLLVAIMVAAGLSLRLGLEDSEMKSWIIGILYPGVGIALMIGGLLARKVEPL